MGEIQFIIDEKNALQDKLSALESKYLENTGDLVNTRNKCITLQQQHDNLMHMISELNSTVHGKTQQLKEVDELKHHTMVLKVELHKAKEELQRQSSHILLN